MSRILGIIRSFTRSALAGVLLVTVLTSGLFLGTPKKADALLGGGIGGPVTVIGGIGTIQDTLSAASNAITAGVQNSLYIKEFVLDDIAYQIAKKVLAQSTRSLIDWINSGFQGKPAFITNLDDYLLNAADEVAGGFLAESNFAALCQPLQMPVRIIINNYYQKARSWQEESQCTLSGAADNIQDFLNGNFNNGGWHSWFQMVSEPQNNIYGAAAIGISRTRDTVVETQNNKKEEANWSNGFLSVKDCSTGKCITVTPGNLISEYLNFKLTVGDRTLIASDEINEVIGALFAQLGNQVFMGIGGLLGTSYSSDGVSPSYLDQFGQEISMMGSNSGSSEFITDIIRVEVQYQAMYEKGLEDVKKLETKVDSCPAAGGLKSEVASTSKKYQAEVDATGEVVETLTYMKSEFDNAFQFAADNPDAGIDPLKYREWIVNTIMQLQKEGLFHTTADLEFAKNDIAEKVVDLQTKVNAACGA